MKELEFRTVSAEEMDIMMTKEESKKGKVIEILKTIGGTICCVIAAAVIGLFLYVMLTQPAVETECTFSKWAFVNSLCEFGMRCTHNESGIVIIPLCIAAILVELLCAKPINYVLQKLPLGRFPAVPTEAMPKITALNSMLPALIVGIHIAVYLLSAELDWAGGIEFSKNAILVTVILVGIVLLFLLINTILQAGLWGFLLRGSLILVSNFGLSIAFAFLAEVIGMLVIVIGLMALGIIIFYFILRAFAIVSLFS